MIVSDRYRLIVTLPQKCATGTLQLRLSNVRDHLTVPAPQNIRPTKPICTKTNLIEIREESKYDSNLFCLRVDKEWIRGLSEVCKPEIPISC